VKNTATTQTRISALLIAVSSLSLSSCGRGSVALPNGGTIVTAITRGATSNAYSVLYRFEGGRTDGTYPYANLVDVNGTLYSTTFRGGERDAGTVFSISTAGIEQVLYSFAGGKDFDGGYPAAGLINVNGTLYGTTVYGGSSHHGTVFSIGTTGTERVLHSFEGGADGVEPEAGLVNVNGTLYGTTSGGLHGDGTVFSITTTGTERVLYHFKGGTDGAGPYAGLIDVNGTLYGTTISGGGPSNNGTVFSVSTTGTEHVLHRFAGATDGAQPEAGLLDVNGTLYGTTTYGGGSTGGGTVFKIDTAGNEQVVHRFGSGADGWGPAASLVDVNGTLYGTTLYGGGNDKGTVFSISTTGTERVIYSFGSTVGDGTNPEGALIAVNGALYGTTDEGGEKDGGLGNGIVYKIIP
jgi:uncharacterized repeat protein (TIGR03803 family)